MTKRMLIDATHAEETRVVVLDGSRLEDFDVETSAKRHLKGNIYLAKVVRVEPSLQAAFVEYGGNRHGFLAFSEIHPDYYQIPVADRQRLLEMEAEEARREEEEDELEFALSQTAEAPPPPPARPQRMSRERRREAAPPPVLAATPAAEAWAIAGLPALTAALTASTALTVSADPSPHPWARAATPALVAEATPTIPTPASWARPDHPALDTGPNAAADAAPGAWALAGAPALLGTAAPAEAPADAAAAETAAFDPAEDDVDDDIDTIDHADDQPPPEMVGGDVDSVEDSRERRMPPRFMRNYKIQEVIRRRQIMLIQVVKEERGTKGAALTTYLSLAGRFSVLMPNSPRGGGISRKITSAADRRRLREVMTELDIPRGMGLIIRTAGAARPKPEIKRDCEYLLRLWDDIREHTMKSVAPALIYEEASLIKRAIRDVYSRDIDEIVVDGQEGWRAAHDFMRMLMPSHAKKVQLWAEGAQPLFARNQVEAQLDAMLSPIVQLRSGGYLVINQAEALVAIDVNSGRSTRERNIEETALRTNLEAADEAARQLRLRDLAGLIVIDFIDMESKRHNAMVERRLKEALKNDRARIQVGHISHFGLMEMSRQRLRPSLTETSFITCPHCAGTGHVRSTESAAIHVLRGIEDEGSKRRAAEIVVHVSTSIALYLLNHKRERLREIEMRYGMRVIIAADDGQVSPHYRIERARAQVAGEVASFITPDMVQPIAAPAPARMAEAEVVDAPDVPDTAEDDEFEAVAPQPEDEDAEEARAEETAEPRDGDGRKRRRRRRRGRRDDDGPDSRGEARAEGPEESDSIEVVEVIEALPVETAAAAAPAEGAEPPETTPATEAETETDDEARARRRGRRGGRRRRRDSDGEIATHALPGADQPDLLGVYTGPTPANPFGGQAFDIFDVMDQVERQAESRTAAPVAEPVMAEPVAAVAEAPAEPAGAWAMAAMPALRAGSVLLAEPPAPPAVEPAPVADHIAEVAVIEPVPEPVVPEPVAEPVAAEPAVAVMAETSVEEAPPEPAIKPILVGAETEAPVEKKRGWWRR